MKRFAALLTAFLFLLGASALAFTGQGYPAWDGAAISDDSLSGAFGDERISLAFDPSDDYSNVMDGLIQACFFAYDESEENYLELYLLLPEDVQPGDVLKSGESLDSSIYLYEIGPDSETLYFAGDIYSAYDGSRFELTIESAENTGSTLSVSGQLTAHLCRYANDTPTREFLNISRAYFHFTLPVNANPFAPAPSQQPSEDSPNLPGAPAFTLPPNYVTI